MTYEQELQLKILGHAAQVALEFLRARPIGGAEEAAKKHNMVFKEVYQGMIDTAKLAHTAK